MAGRASPSTPGAPTPADGGGGIGYHRRRASALPRNERGPGASITLSSDPPLRVLCVGAGYFGRFHHDAWRRMDDVELLGICDLDAARRAEACRRAGCADARADPAVAIDRLRPDVVDIITPPPTHHALVELAGARGCAVICQKPLTPTYDEAARLVAMVERLGVPFMVHENFRFQPWHRQIRRLLDAGAIGRTLHAIAIRTRMGDGHGEDAYLARQPYFRTMPRLLVHETGVHVLDTFRYLGGPIDGVFATLRKRNPAIAGEDAGVVLVEFASGATGLWDASRFNESTSADPRYTFGQVLVDADGGSIRVDEDGRLTVQPLGRPEREHDYAHERRGFAGDCVYHAQRHFVECLRDRRDFETNGRSYLHTLRLVEAAYTSAATGRPVRGLAQPDPHGVKHHA